jgi:hypothetical protein
MDPKHNPNPPELVELTDEDLQAASGGVRGPAPADPPDPDLIGLLTTPPDPDGIIVTEGVIVPQVSPPDPDGIIVYD